MKEKYHNVTIDQIIDSVYPVPAEVRVELLQHIEEVKLPKGHLLLRADKTETDIYFIKKGIVRAFATADAAEITFWFGREGDAIISMRSYVAGEKGYEDIELLEDCELYKLSTPDLQRLYRREIHLANWGRKFAEQELIKTEERLISRQFRNATERYRELLEHNPDLIRRVSLRHIASYLGITQVSLSRIRAGRN